MSFEELNKALTELQEELKTTKDLNKIIEEVKDICEKAIKKYQTNMDNILEQANNGIESLEEQSISLNKSSKTLKKSIEDISQRLKELNLTNRFDNLDSLLNNILTRFDTIERNIKDDISNKFEKINEIDKNISLIKKIVIATIVINVILLVFIVLR